MLLVIAILLVLVLIGIARCIVIVPQSNAYVTEWLGVYKDTWGAGLHLRTPFVERVSRKVSLKEEAADFPPQPVITRDNVTMMIDTVVFFQVFDAKLFAYGVNRPIQAIENLSATTLRDIIGSMSLDETLTSRDLINTKITASLDEATDRWDNSGRNSMLEMRNFKRLPVIPALQTVTGITLSLVRHTVSLLIRTARNSLPPLRLMKTEIQMS